MIVCHCTALNDQAIRAAVDAGCRDADEVSAACGAGGQCGGCFEMIEQIVEVSVHRSSVLAA